MTRPRQTAKAKESLIPLSFVRLCCAAAMAALGMVSVPAWSQEATSPSPGMTWFGGGKSGIRMGISGGVLHGDSHELVYEPPGAATVSKLNWTFDEVPVITGVAAIPLLDWLALTGRGSIAVGERATMDDFDFLVPAKTDWSDWSHHDDTKLTSYTSLDLGAQATVLSGSGARLLALAGYKWDRFGWEASNGTFVYTSATFRDTTGAFEGLGISYDQWFETPYLGIGAEVQLGDVTVRGSVTGSQWVSSHDRDMHHFRGLLFTENFGTGDMLGTDLEIGVQVTDKLSVTAGYHFQKYYLVKGPTVLIDQQQGETTVFPGDSAGADHQSEILSFGVTYTLN